MKTNIRERSTRYQCFIRPKVHFVPEFSFKPFKVYMTFFFYPNTIGVVINTILTLELIQVNVNRCSH